MLRFALVLQIMLRTISVMVLGFKILYSFPKTVKVFLSLGINCLRFSSVKVLLGLRIFLV